MKKQIKILYVDDEPLNLFIFREQFSKKYRVSTALSGKDGLFELENDDGIIFVISDMRMPEMNGLEFIKLAKSKHQEVLFCILTGLESIDEIKEALDSKLIFRCFSKPYDRKAIEGVIDLALSERNERN